MRISISKITPDSEQTSTAKMATVKKPVPVTPAKAELKAAKRGEMTDTGTSARDPVAQEQKQVVDKAFTTADLAAQNSAIAQRDIAQQGLNILQNPSQIYDPAVTGGLTEQYAAARQAGLAARITQQQYQQAATEYRDALNQQLYGGLRSNRDYASMSQGDKETAVKGYSGLNGKDLKLYSQMYYRGNDPTLSENPLHRDPTAFATDEQAADFFYLWNKKGPDAARAYYNDYLLPSLNQQKTSAAEGYARDIADKAPVAASGLSVATNLAGSAGIVDIALQNMTRRFGGDKSKPIDYNTAAQLPSRVTNEIRQEVSKNIEKSVDSPFWKAALPFLYETGMSMADSGVMILLNKVGVPEGVTLAAMGGSAGTAAIRDAKERGATDGQALAEGIAYGIAEAVFEKLSLDKILKATKPQGLKAGILEALKQGFIEGSEETATSLANTIADFMIMRDKSEIDAYQQKLMESGVSEKEAAAAATKWWLKGIASDALGGLISGFGMGGGNQLALGLTHTVSDVKDTVNILSQNREDIRQAQAEQQESEAPASAPEAPQPKSAPVITAATRNTDPLGYATDKVQSGNELTGGDIRAVQDNAEAMQTLRNAGVLEDKIAPGAEGREQIRNAVQDYAAQASNINEEETIGNEDQNRERAAEERQNTERGEERDTGMVPRLRFSDTYRDVRDTKRQIRSAVESRVAASAAGLNQRSAAEIGLKNGTDTRSITELTDDVLTAKQRDAVKRYANEGVNLHFINGFMEQRADDGSLSRARGWINNDGTEIWVQADHPRLSWEYILEHEDLHKEIKNSPALREQILDDIRNDPNVAPYFDELADRYAKAYADTNMSPEDIYEELLCDYRAGFDALYDYDRKRGKQLQKAINLSIKRNAGTRQTSETSTQRPTLPSRQTGQTKTTPQQSEGPKMSREMESEDVRQLEKQVEQSKPLSSSDESRASREFDRKYMTAAMAYNDKNGFVPKSMMKDVAKVRETIKQELEKINDTAHLPEDIEGNTYFDNSSYSGSEEVTTVCPRSLSVDALADAVGEALGRPLTIEETVYVAQQAFHFTDIPQCLYCYVAMDRMAKRQLLGDYINQRTSVINNLEKGMSREEALAAYKKEQTAGGKKWSKNKQARFDMWVQNYESGAPLVRMSNLASEDAVEKALKDDRLRAETEDALQYAQNASWAKKRVGFTAYNGHILKWDQQRVDDLNSMFGLRMYSFSDYSPAYLLENMQMVTDAAARGLKMLAYTKELDFVKVFAGTGMNINISTFGMDGGDGSVHEDAMQGAAWKEAQDLRKRFPNVGITFVATNDNQVNWALDQDWIDVVIPFHMVKTGATVAGILGYQNYTAESSDKKIKGVKAKQKEIFPSQHQNDKQKYLDALKEANLTPRFERWIDHPNYMKLVNETRRSAGDTPAVLPVFDQDAVDAALKSLDDMVKRGGYGVPIGGSLENLADIALEMSDDIRKGIAQDLKERNKGKASREITSQQDTDYLSAVKRGDMETAQRMVDEAAKGAGAISENGRPIYLYHGTKKFGFTSFDLSKMDDKQSIFLTDNLAVAKSYSGTYAVKTASGRVVENDNVGRMTLDEAVQAYNKLHPNDKQYKVVDQDELQKRIDEMMAKVRKSAEAAEQALSDDDWLDTMISLAKADAGERAIARTWLQTVAAFKQAKTAADLRKAYDNYTSVNNLFVGNGSTSLLRQLLWIAVESENLANEPRFAAKFMEQLGQPGVWDGRYSYWTDGQFKEILRDELSEIQGEGNYALYAFADKILTVDAAERAWDSISFIPPELRRLRAQMRGIEKANNGVTVGNERYERLDREFWDKADALYEQYGLNVSGGNTTRSIVAWAKANGYDGVKFEEVIDVGEDTDDYIGSDVYVIFDPSQVKSADPVTYDDDGNAIPLSERFNAEQEDIRYSREVDPTVLAELDRAEKNGDVIRLYRTMQILDIDGQKVMMSPMNARRGKGKDVKWDPPFAILNDDGSIKDTYWSKADESPELRTKSGKFPLKKGVGFKDMPVAYNPYMHGTLSMLNDQFSTAYKRPNLVTVEVIVPKSEESHGYKAEGAKDPVGWTDWKAGTVSTAKAQAGGEARDLFLSRWMKPVRIIPDSEVADHIINSELKGTDIKIPANVVTPSMLEEIRKIDPDRIAEPDSRYAEEYNEYQNGGSSNSIELDPGVIDAYYNSLPISKKEQPERKISKTRTNTYELSGFFDKVINDLKDADEGMYAYDVVHEKQTTDAARERLLADFDGAVEDLINKEYWTAADVDTAMGILHVYKQRGNLTGDYTDFLEFSQIVHPMVRQDARALQAMAKYSRTAAEEARKAAQSVKEAAGQLTPAEEKKVKQATDDVKKAAKDSAKEAAEETVKAAAGELKDSRMTRDALNLIREIYDNLNVNNKEGNYPVKAWTTLTGDELARRIASRFSDRRKQRTTMQLMLSDLLRFAQEHALPERQKVSGRTATDIISDYLNNRNAYAQAWGEAQAYLRAVYSEDEDKLNALDSFLNATISQNADPQHVDRMMFDAILESADTLGITEKQIKDITATGVTEGTIRRIADELVRQVKDNLSQDFDGSFETQLRDAVRRYINGVALSMSADQRGLRLQRMENRASRALGIKMTELLTQSKQTKAAAANSIAQYLISELDVPATDAAIIADAIAQDYIDRLAQKADARLQKMFEQRPEATRMKKSQRQKLLELIRLGGLTNQSVEDAVVDALGLGKISRAKQREIMTNMAQFADTYDAMEAGDLEGLRNLIRRQAAYRKTKLSRMTEQFLNNEGDEEYLRSFAMSQLASIAEDYRPRGVGQKISTWQTIAHLLNPKTGLRNVGSNEGFDVIATAANNVSMVPDMIMGLFTGKRHTIGLETGWLSKAKRQGAKEGGRRSALEVSLDVNFDESGGTGKYGNKTRRTFSMAGSNALGRIMSHLEKALGYELNVTDEIHKGGIRRETLESLARYVEKGYMTQEQANEIAEQEALYRSFQDDTAVGTILRTLKEGFNVIGIGDNGKAGRSKAMRHTWGLGDLITKYTQVPGALIHRAIEFSPLGYAKALYNIGQLANEARKGNDVTLAQRKAALAIGQATTGTGLILLFRALAKMGLLLRGSDKDKDKNAMALKAGQGLSGTQLNLDGLGRAISGGSSKLEDGDTLIDLGFLEPLDSLMTIAALMSDNKDFDVKSDGIDTLEGIYKALENTSAMQTFSDVMNTIRYHDPENDLPLGIQIPVEVASSGVSGFVPGPVRHVAQAMDTDYRDQYRSQNVLAQMLARTMNSIPGVREKLAPKITPLGQEKQYQAGPVARVLNAVANPATISVYNSTRVTDELDKLYDATGDAKIWPERNAPYTVTIGDKITLTPDERTEYQTVRGGTVRAGMEQLLRMSWYTKLSPDTRAEVVNWLENFANYVAKVDFADGRRMNYTSSMYDSYLKEMEDGKTIGQVVESKYSGLATAIDADIPEQSYTGYKTFASTATADKNADGKTISGSKRDKVLDYIDNIPGLTIDQKDILYYDAGYAKSEIDKAPWHNGSSSSSGLQLPSASTNDQKSITGLRLPGK